MKKFLAHRGPPTLYVTRPASSAADDNNGQLPQIHIRHNNHHSQQQLRTHQNRELRHKFQVCGRAGPGKNRGFIWQIPKSPHTQPSTAADRTLPTTPLNPCRRLIEFDSQVVFLLQFVILVLVFYLTNTPARFLCAS